MRKGYEVIVKGYCKACNGMVVQSTHAREDDWCKECGKIQNKLGWYDSVYVEQKPDHNMKIESIIRI